MSDKMSQDELNRRMKLAGRFTSGIRGALQSIVVNGETWRGAAHKHGVTESGILRAMRRIRGEKSNG